MSEFKGTPGKWFYRAELGELASTHKGVIADLLCDSYQDENGYLLAAAPELLQALKEMVAIVKKNTYPTPDKPSSNWGRMEAAEQAIAKALGETK